MATCRVEADVRRSSHRTTAVIFLVVAAALTGCSHGSGPHPAPSATESVGRSVGPALVPEAVRLMPAWPTVRRYCRLGATRTGLAVPCPTVAPRVRHPAGDWELCRGVDGALEGRGCHRRTFTIEERFRGPAGYRGIDGRTGPTRLGHLVIWAARGTVGIGAHSPAGCPVPRAAGTTTVDGVTGRWYFCRAGFADLDSGHVLLVWERDGVTYGVGAHGQTDANRQLVQRVAEQLAFAEPGRRS